MTHIASRRPALDTSVFATALVAPFLSPAALAQTPRLDEVRAGIIAHSIESGHSESGIDINIEALFRRPAVAYSNPFVDVLLRPRAHVGTSINVIGDTSQIYAGLTWDFALSPRLSLEASFGGAWHDGPTGTSAPDSYGCSVNFRESISIGYALDDAWTVYGTLAHMSNADLCEHNSGISSAGIRLGYKLK